MMSTLIISATKKQDYTRTILYDSLSLMDKIPQYKFYTSNSLGLSKVYNQAIDEYAKDYECMIFCHDDLFIDDAFMTDKLRNCFYGLNSFDIVGLAGGLYPKLERPALWHIMCERDNLRGMVGHPINSDMTDSPVYYSSFGYTPSRVSIIDGVFMAINTKRILDVGWRFNENFDFHLYDISSCIDANKLKLRIGVAPIYCIHNSPGLKSLEDPVFQRNQETFFQLYSA